MLVSKFIRGGAHRRTGFTLVELMIVVVIVAILASASAPLYFLAVTKAKVSEGICACGVIRMQMRIYYGSHGHYPTLMAADGNDLRVIHILPGDLDGKFFKATDYEVSSNDSTYTITTTYVTSQGEAHTYILDQEGDELGTITTQ